MLHGLYCVPLKTGEGLWILHHQEEVIILPLKITCLSSMESQVLLDGFTDDLKTIDAD